MEKSETKRRPPPRKGPRTGTWPKIAEPGTSTAPTLSELLAKDVLVVTAGQALQMIQGTDRQIKSDTLSHMVKEGRCPLPVFKGYQGTWMVKVSDLVEFMKPTAR